MKYLSTMRLGLYDQVADYYDKSDLLDSVLHLLKVNGYDLNNLKTEDLSAFDEFHVRGAEVSKELAEFTPFHNSRVLDVGCGIGGPARMLAEHYGCSVTGIDLSYEFIRTAQELTKLVGLNQKLQFIQGNAVDLPFQNHVFDVVWTQHAQMNIPDKFRFYEEVNRVLRPGGLFIYYDIYKTMEQANIYYPMPWADRAELSFLIRKEEVNGIFDSLNFEILHSVDQTHHGIVFFENLFKRVRKTGPPKLGIQVIMGPSALSKLKNLMIHLQANKLQIYSGVLQKQGA